MSYTVTVAATVEPITLAEAKMHLRVDHDDEDSLIEAYLAAARTHCERFTGLSFVEQTVKAVFRKEEAHTLYLWPLYIPSNGKTFDLPLSPVNEIVSAKDGEGNDVDYTSDLQSIPAVITLEDEPDILVLEYTTKTASVTPLIKVAILMILHQMYEYRGDVMEAKAQNGLTAVERVEEAYLRSSRVLRGMA